MERDACPKDTVLIHFADYKMFFRNEADAIVEVGFLKPTKGRTDTFRLCCCIAIAQFFYTSKDNLTSWSGADMSFIDVLKKNFGWDVSLQSISTYWSQFKSGENASPIRTHILVDDNDATKTLAAKDLFNNIKKGGFVLGVPMPLEKDKHRLWSIKFVDPDEEFEEFRNTVLKILRKARVLAFPNDGHQVIDAVEKIGDSPYALNTLLDLADESVLIAGQNLYTLVRDEIEMGGVTGKYEGFFRFVITKWLNEKKGKRRMQLLFCDPKESEVSVNNAMIFGKDYIHHLCGAIMRFNIWQQDLASLGLDIKVTRVVPLSLVALDATKDNKNARMVIITPMTSETNSAKRPAFMVTMESNKGISGHYYGAFSRLLGSRHTRGVSEVSEDDLRRCKELMKRNLD